MNRHCGRLAFVCALILGLVLLMPISLQAEPTSSVVAIGDRAADWLDATSAPAGAFTLGARWRDAELTAQALAVTTRDPNRPAVASVFAEAPKNNDALARGVVVSALMGSDASASVTALLADQRSDGGFGLCEEYPSDSWDTALALEALAESDSDRIARLRAIEYLLAQQNPDGSWSMIPGSNGDSFMTSTVVLALMSDPSFGSNAELGQTVSAGSAWLLGTLQEDGSFGSYAHTALAFRALMEAGAPFDARASLDWLASHANADGSLGTGSVYDTALGILALRSVNSNIVLAQIEVENATPRMGQTVATTVTVTNTGQRRVSGVQLNIGLMNSASEQVAEYAQSLGDLNPGQSKSVRYVAATEGLLGQVTIAAEVTSTATIETSDADNSGSAALFVRPALGQPLTLTPQDGQTLATGLPTLVWAPAEQNMQEDLMYCLQLDRTPSFDSPSLREIESADLFYQIASGAVLADGTWYWRVRATDGATISGWSASSSISIDGTSPRVLVSSRSASPISPNGDGFRDVFDIECISSEAVTVSVELLDTSRHTLGWVALPQNIGGQPSSIRWDGTCAGVTVPDGNYTLVVRGSDAVGNAALPVEVGVAVDNTAAGLADVTISNSVISPNGDGLFESTTLTWDDETNATTVLRIYNPLGVVIYADKPTTNSHMWTGRNIYNSIVVDGDYVFELLSEDAAGNRSAVTTKSVTVKTSCALGPITLDPPVVPVGGTSVIRVPVSDSSTVSVTLAGVKTWLADPDGDSVLTGTLSAPAIKGNYALTVEARDSFGNVTRPSGSALIVRGDIPQGQLWTQDTQNDFWFGGSGSVAASTSIQTLPGSVVLCSNGWDYLGEMNPPRLGSMTALGPDGKIYVIGGFMDDTTSGRWTRYSVLDNESFDPVTQTWSEHARIPSARMLGRAVCAPNGKIYVMGGDSIIGPAWDGSFQFIPTSTVEAYDPATNTWERDTDHGGTLAPMPSVRESFGAALGRDGRIYAIAGYTETGESGGSTSAVDVYDPITNTWSKGPDMPLATCCAAVSGMDGRIYVAEGEFNINPGTTLDFLRSNTFIYDPTLGTWTERALSPFARTDVFAAPGRDGRMYVYGGRAAGSPNSNLVSAYDPASNSWIRMDSMPQAVKYGQGVADADGRVYAFGGGQSMSGDMFTHGDIQRLDPYFRPKGTFTSWVKDVGRSAAFGAITWDATLPAGTSLTLATRTSKDNVSWSEWSDEYSISGSSILSPNGRYIQYRATLKTSDPLVRPELGRVSIAYNLCPINILSSPSQTSTTRRPNVTWKPAVDVESDPITYRVDLDTRSSFDSANLKTLGSAAANVEVPANMALSDGTWYARVKPSDGYSEGDWSPTFAIRVDATPPAISGLSVSAPVVSIPASELATVGIGFSTDEAASGTWMIRRKVGSTYSTMYSATFSSSSGAGAKSGTWNGLDQIGQPAPSGQYQLRVEASDDLGNKSQPAELDFAVRQTPSVERVAVNLDASGAAPSCEVIASVNGSATAATVELDSVAYSLLASGTAGRYTSTFAVSSVADSVDGRIIASDALANASRTVTGRFDLAGAVSTNAWRESSTQDFQSGSLSGVLSQSGTLELPARSWQSTAHALVTARSEMGFAQQGRLLYLVGGIEDNNRQTAEVLDLETGRSQALPNMAKLHGSMCEAALSADGRLFVFGGTMATNSFECFDPSTQKWTDLGNMPGGHYGGAAFRVPDGRIFVLGGSSTAVHAYDPATGSWTTKAPVPVASYGQGCYVDGRYYTFTGANGAVQIYDVASNTWSLGPALSAVWANQCVVAAEDGLIHLYGPSPSWPINLNRPDHWTFDPRTSRYSRLAPPPSNMARGAGAAYGGRLYFVGGKYVNTPSDGMSTYNAVRTGLYDSSVFDAGQQVDWDAISWSAFVPDGTQLGLSTRSSVDGITWSSWSLGATVAGSDIDSPSGRYLQYRVEMTAPRDPAPALGDVLITFDDGATSAPLDAPRPIGPAGRTLDSVPSPTWFNSDGGVIRTYEVEIDRSQGFDTQALRNYAGIIESPSASTLHLPTSATLEDGTWYWRVRAFDGDRYSDWSAASEFEVVTRPDLALEDVVVPSSVLQGDVVEVAATVTNAGTGCGAFASRLIDDESGEVLAQATIPAVAAESDSTLRFAVDTSYLAGQRSLTVIVDPQDAIIESDEGNNSAAVVLDVEAHGLNMSVSTNPKNGAEETATVAVVVSNASASPRAGKVEAEILDADGALVEALGEFEVGPIAAGGECSTEFAWNTGTYPPGSYDVAAKFVMGERVRTEARSPLEIMPDRNVSARTSVNHLSYGAHEQVQVTSRVMNRSVNWDIEDAVVRTWIEDGAGEIVQSKDASIPTLFRGESRSVGMTWDTSDHAPGTFRVREEVVLADGSVIATNEAGFEVLSTSLTGDGLAATVTVAPTEVHQEEDVTIAFTIGNQGNSAVSLPVRVLVFDPQTTSTVLADFEAPVNIVKGGSAAGDFILDAASLPLLKGDHPQALVVAIYAELSDGLLPLAHAPLTLLPLNVSASVSANAIEYDCWENVALTLEASNFTTAHPLTDVLASLRIIGPNGDEVMFEEREVTEAQPGEAFSQALAWNTGVYPPGEYTGSAAVRLDGMVLTSSTATFTVLSTADTGSGITGSVLLDSAEIRAGEAINGAYQIENDGNASAPQLPVAVVLADESGAVIAEAPDTISLSKGEGLTGRFEFATDGLLDEAASEARSLTVRLEIRPSRGVKSLGQATARVVPGAEASAEVTKSVTSGSRVLVWCESEANRDLADRTLSGMGAYYSIVDSATVFVSKMRSGLFDTFVVLDVQKPLTGHLDDELIERVNSGATLIGSRWTRAEDSAEKNVFGVRFRGSLPDAPRRITTTETTYTPAGTAAAPGKAMRVELTTASSLAVLTDDRGASVGPGITVNRYGSGTSMLFTFDLAEAAEDAAERLLRAAILGCPANESTSDAGDVVAYMIGVTNTGAASVLHVTEQVDRGVIVDAPRAVLVGGSASWELALASGETTRLACLIRRPSTAGTVVATTHVESAGSGKPLAVTTFDIGGTTEGDSVIGQALSDVGSIPSLTSSERERVRRITSDLVELRGSPPSTPEETSSAVRNLVSAATELRGMGAKAALARMSVDELLRFYEASLSDGGLL